MKTLLVGDTIYIPTSCPNTEREYGKIKDQSKKELLGAYGYISQIKDKKIYIKSHRESWQTWFFHLDDLTENSDPVNIPQQIFDPENLMI